MSLWRDPTLHFLAVLPTAPLVALAADAASGPGSPLALAGWITTLVLIAGAAIRSVRSQWDALRRRNPLARGLAVLPRRYVPLNLFVGIASVAIAATLGVLFVSGLLVIRLLRG